MPRRAKSNHIKYLGTILGSNFGGGGGNRTRVRKSFTLGRYMLSLLFIIFKGVNKHTPLGLTSVDLNPLPKGQQRRIEITKGDTLLESLSTSRLARYVLFRQQRVRNRCQLQGC